MNKKVFIALTLTVVAFLSASCQLIDVIKHYEDSISLTEEEEAEYLYGKWKFNKVGYALVPDEYGVEQVEVDENLPVVSAIESIEIQKNKITLNFKGTTKLIRRYVPEEDQGVIREEELWLTSYTSTPDGPTMSFGFTHEGVEEFDLYEPFPGGLQYQLHLYGIEGLNDYKIKRVVLHASGGYGYYYEYYEFVPMD